MLAVTPSMPANCNASWRTMALPVCSISAELASTTLGCPRKVITANTANAVNSNSNTLPRVKR